MKFWDASAIIPLCVEEPQTVTVERILREDNSMAVWWVTVVECRSAFARLRREGVLTAAQEAQIHATLSEMAQWWTEMLPGEDIRDTACRLFLRHPLRAADALQLAAALAWAGPSPAGFGVVCLDRRLREAARAEGFTIVPEYSDPGTAG